MPKVRLIKVHSKNYFDCDYEDLYQASCDAMSVWQEVTEEELSFLLDWKATNFFKSKNLHVVVFQDKTENLSSYILDLKKFIEEENLKEKKRIEKYQEIEKKKKLLAEQKKIERAKKLLEKNGINVG